MQKNRIPSEFRQERLINTPSLLKHTKEDKMEPELLFILMHC